MKGWLVREFHLTLFKWFERSTLYYSIYLRYGCEDFAYTIYNLCICISSCLCPYLHICILSGHKPMNIFVSSYRNMNLYIHKYKIHTHIRPGAVVSHRNVGRDNYIIILYFQVGRLFSGEKVSGPKLTNGGCLIQPPPLNCTYQTFRGKVLIFLVLLVFDCSIFLI